jgi:hypothetical protein
MQNGDGHWPALPKQVHEFEKKIRHPAKHDLPV